MSTSKQQQLKKATLTNDLHSGDPKKISAALKALEIHGDASIIAPILELWQSDLTAQNETDLKDLLVGLKDTSTISPLMEAFRTSDNRDFQRKLLNVFWNSKLDFSEYLSDFVLFAIEGNFMDCLETLTIIENFEFGSPESAIMESQLLLKEFFSTDENPEPKKYELLQEIAILLKDFEGESDMDDVLFEEED